MTEPVRRSETPKMRAPSYRARMRAAGYRPVQIWVPDTRNPEIAERIRAEARALAQQSDNDDVMDWIEAVYEWPET